MITLIYILILFILVWAMYRITQNEDGSVHVLDFGLIVSAVMILYMVLPTLGFLFLNEGNLALMGFRISELDPKSSHINQVLGNAVAILVGIVLAYKMQFKGNYIVPEKIRIISSNIYSKSIIGFIASGIILFIIKLMYGLNAVESYNESYTVFWAMPKLVKQLFLVFQDVFTFCKIIIFIYLIQHNRSSWKWIFLLYLFFTVFFYDSSGSRTSLFVEVLLMIALYHIYIKKISKRGIFLLVILGLILFSFLGISRSQSSESFLLSNYLVIGEFVNIWANAVHLVQLSGEQNLSVPTNVSLSELLSFIPSQILPFEKLDYAVWYMRSFFPESLEQGNGLAFGIVAQSISDGGPFFGFFRGFILGSLFIWISRLVKLNKFWWSFPIYLLFYLGIYNTVRSSSFELFTSPILKFTAIVFVFSITAKKISTSTDMTRSI